ncbi:cupredoxin domain-containing protein [Phenylobacterium sp.]|jgi:cytochrome c peroxidase|uniref:cupredoxin domain-containing protein n=1 Tax=Phenylobacterium sp. TaxID=1871053 RepID=UPI002F411960
MSLARARRHADLALKAYAVLGGAAVIALATAAWAATVFTVDQKNLKFSVRELTISKGDSVEFTNSDDTSHNITVSGAGFTLNSGLQKPGQPFKVPLVKTGVYKVSCGIHPNMRMTVTVE